MRDADAAAFVPFRGGAGRAPARPAPASRPVPLRALALSMTAMTAALGAAWFWPQDLLDHEVLASMLALVPALLLAQYRGWTSVSILLAVGMITLCLVHLALMHFGRSVPGAPFMLLVVAPYLAIALGAGWFGEVRRYQAELRATQLQLIQSEKLDSIGQMAAGVAHEVKNPLMTILTGVRILATRLPEADATTRLVLQDMTEAVQRADKIISELLSYSRDRELDPTPSSLNAGFAGNGRSLTLAGEAGFAGNSRSLALAGGAGFAGNGHSLRS